MIRWTLEEELDAFLASRATGFILKHSTRCPISAAALEEVEAFSRDEPEVPVFLVLVIESRLLSNAVSEKFGVQHESPQAILVRDGAVAWHASHGGITRGEMAGAWRGRGG
jgi:bacillithiol system protein YtxJ